MSIRKTWLCVATLALLLDPTRAAEPEPPGVTLTQFEPNLPILHLSATEAIVSERKVPGQVRLSTPEANSPENTGALPGLVRFHGASSQGYPKKSFALTLEKPVRWLGLRESAQWVLNAAFVDRSLMRHKLSYDLFRSLSGPGHKRYAAGSRFVEVKLNGRYHGAYLLMERVDGALLELRRFDSNAPSQACVYKAENHGADFGAMGHAAFEQRDPDPLVMPYWGPLDRFARFASRSTESEFHDLNVGIASRLDLENTIDFHLLILLTSNLDGTDKNQIFARNVSTPEVPAPRFFFAPWDYDATFGRNWDAGRVSPNEWLSNHLFDRLLGDAAYRRKFAARWQQLRGKEFSAATLRHLIDENVRTLGPAAQRNEERWRTLNGLHPDRLNFAQDVAQMQEWTAARLQWLDEEIARRTPAVR